MTSWSSQTHKPSNELSPATWKRYRGYLRQTPALTLHWHDRETGARAWLVINSLRGGAAGGGTRMRAGCNEREVMYLAKAMELKFALCGPPIGGAKNGIDFDPADPRKPQVLERWYRAIRPYLRDHYGTGGDLGTDEVLDVVPTFQRIGLRHPQEGVLRGHLQPDAAALDGLIARMDGGVVAPVQRDLGSAHDDMTVADMITGYGVALSVRRLYELRGGTLEGVRVMVEGFGNVGAACALYLARFGARITAIRDAEKALVVQDGLNAEQIDCLLAQRSNKLLPRQHPHIVERSDFWSASGDVFVSAALSGTLDAGTLDTLAQRGVRVIACGANQPFRESQIGSSRVAQLADRRFSVLADIVANLGMARTFSYLMEPAATTSARVIFDAVERTVTANLDEVVARAGERPVGLHAATIGLALDRIGAD